MVSLAKIELRIASSVASIAAANSAFNVSTGTASCSLEIGVSEGPIFSAVEKAMEMSPL